MHDDDKLYAELSRDEGKRLGAYQDSRGLWTIGIGHLLGTIARMSMITEEECRALFDADVQVAILAVDVIFGMDWYINDDPANDDENDVRFRALVNMTFNRGEKQMKESTSITPAVKQAIQTKNWSLVEDAIKGTPWAKEVGARADRLAYMLKTGKEPA